MCLLWRFFLFSLFWSLISFSVHFHVVRTGFFVCLVPPTFSVVRVQKRIEFFGFVFSRIEGSKFSNQHLVISSGQFFAQCICLLPFRFECMHLILSVCLCLYGMCAVILYAIASFINLIFKARPKFNYRLESGEKPNNGEVRGLKGAFTRFVYEVRRVLFSVCNDEKVTTKIKFSVAASFSTEKCEFYESYKQ